MPTTEIGLPAAAASTYIVVWEYQVKPECEAEFVAAYGSEGDWARLFRRSAEFQGLELLGSAGNTGRFFTLDRWSSAAAMDVFLNTNATAYDVLDRRFSELTVWERRIGGFSCDAQIKFG
jgi:Antibiotic biosynthesis monooxygenase